MALKGFDAILRGYVDFYCLVCESQFFHVEDVDHHIEEQTHIRNLKGNCFLEKYKDDFIRKVKKGYFCEFCNILLSTAAKVGLHICEEAHVHNKGTQSLTRLFKSSSLGVVAFDNTLIPQQAWDGLIDNTCVLCNSEFDDEKEHRNETTHILNLVQSKVAFVEKNIYRKIDDSSLQCLTCNTVLAINSLTAHFDSSAHKKHYMEISNNFEKAAKAQNLKEKTSELKTESKKPENDVKKPETLLATEKPAHVAKKTEPNTPKPTPATEAPKKAEIPPPVKKNRVIPPKVTQEFDTEIANLVDAKDYIVCDENGEKWCLLCDWSMDSLVINNHVNGKHHAAMVTMHKKRLEQKSREIKIIQDSQIPDVVEDITKDPNIDEIDEIITAFQDYIEIEMGEAVCKICSKVLTLVDTKLILRHVEEHKQSALKKDAKPSPNAKESLKTGAVQKTEEFKRQVSKEKDSRASSVASKHDKESRASSVASVRDEEAIEKFAKVNNLTYNRKDSKAYCHACDSLVPYSLKNMKEHVAGTSHKNKVARSLQHSPSKDVEVKMPMAQFLISARAVENGIMRDVVINNKFCLNILSFMTILCLDGERSKCESCEVTLDRVDQIEEHVSSQCHQKVMAAVQVTVSADEFLREIRSETIHCGFCNIVLTDEELPLHLSSTQHKEAKTYSFWRLLQYQQYNDLDSEVEKHDVNMFMLVKLLSEELF